jgi:hypothetical protein
MARVKAVPVDERGAVYLEFLIAFMPVFLLFLAICQLALIAMAELVVRHAAYAAVRSAVVVLEDDPAHYGGAPRGWISTESTSAPASMNALFEALGIPSDLASSFPAETGTGKAGTPVAPQGARMVSIRTAAYVPLLVLAPSGTGDEPASVAKSVTSELETSLLGALAYTRSASAVTLHTDSATDRPAIEPIARDAAVTARVTYLYECGVPLVRSLMCRSLASVLASKGDDATSGAANAGASATVADRLQFAEAPSELQDVTGSEQRFRALTAAVTLPNQGAAYDAHGTHDAEQPAAQDETQGLTDETNQAPTYDPGNDG